MSVYSICFSPTGGTKRVMECLEHEMAEAVIPVDLTDRTKAFEDYRFTAEDLCLIGVPSYGGRVPAVALERLGRMQGGGARAVLVVSYGNRAWDDTLLELEEASRERGFVIAGAVTAVAEHSIMRQYGAGRPDQADREELRQFAGQIQARLDEPGRPDGISAPGNHPFREYKGLPLKPVGKKGCTHCGLCAAKCPVGAIPDGDPASVDKAVCISCMRCLAVCPTGARRVNSLLLAVAGKAMKKMCGTRKENELFL